MSGSSHTLKLATPVQFGSEEVAELVIRRTGRIMKDLKMRTNPNGDMEVEPWPLAVAGVRAAGRPAAEKFVELMDPADIMEVASVVMGFLSPPQKTGDTPSP